MRYLDWKKENLVPHFQTDLQKGLNQNEVHKRLKKTGLNCLETIRSPKWWQQFLSQFKDAMVVVLLLATTLSFCLGKIIDAFAILAIVILNAILGTVQEFRAEKSLNALKKLSAPIAKVVRNGKKERVDAKSLVPGDIINLSTGDRVPADIRLLETNNLLIEESSLTGESIPVTKTEGTLPHDTPLADRTTIAHMGTMVVRGHGKGIVVGTGMHTQMGNIAKLIKQTKKMITPLQKRLLQLGKWLIFLSLLLTLIVVIAGIAHGQPIQDMFLSGISLAIAAIPEGLPSIVTISLALGVQRMIKRHAIVRKLPAVETLGCATVIGADKTGTLTENKMSVTHLWLNDGPVRMTVNGLRSNNGEMPNRQTLERLLVVAENCNNAILSDKGYAEGDPTETALLSWAKNVKSLHNIKNLKANRLKENAFDSFRKRMSVEIRFIDGKYRVCAKGAPEILLKLCTFAFNGEKTVALTPKLRQHLLQKSQNMAKKALRVIALADRLHPDNEMEDNLVFLGFVGIMDPPRKDVLQTLQVFNKAGIRTIMITGDHRSTAEAIANQLNMRRLDSKTLVGDEINLMTDEVLTQEVEHADVFARVTPEHKLRIVKALQNAGHIVAMTGDGVNDAPAIKAANIGIAMGKSGTDVAKEAAALVLSNDNFSTILAAVEEGRSIYGNIRKFICYLLASNVGEILLMLLAMLAGLPPPLLPMQILWVNLVTDGLPALALGVDPPEEKVMHKKPRDAKESIFAHGIGWKIATRGLLIALCSLLPFLISLGENPLQLAKAQTIAFTTLVLSQLIFVFDCRSEGTILQRKPWDNGWLLLAIASSALLLGIAIYNPLLQTVFSTVDLALREWILIIIMSFLPVVLAGLLDRCRFQPKKQLCS